MRDLTQTEINEVLQAEQKLRHSGLIVDEADGKEDMDHNTERILAFFDLNVNTPVTVQTILSACEQMRDQLRWKSGAQMEYEKLYNQLAKSQQDQFGSWWHKQGSVLILTENQGFE